MTAMHAASERIDNRTASGIRPFDISRDLRPVADLIAEAFAGELDERGEAALREMRTMGYFGALLALVNRTTGDFRDVLNGFVWIEDGRVVGNITVQQSDRISDRWQIANVAVAPDYRHRGIANRLMDEALDHIQNAGGRWTVLQVYARNAAARHIYDKLNFDCLSGMAEMERPHPFTVVLAADARKQPHLPNFYTFSANDWPELYDLASRQLNTQAQWWRAVRRADLQVTLEQQMGEWFTRMIGRRKVHRRCIRMARQFDAATVLTAQRWSGKHRLQLWVRPEQYGKYEESLLDWAIATLDQYPHWPVELTLTTEHEAAMNAAQRHGFQTKRTLLTMRRDMEG